MGICPRHEVDRLIRVGKVLVDNHPASMRQEVTPGQKVVCNGRMVRVDKSHKPRPVLLTVNRPRGVVCTTTDKDRAESIVDFLGYPERTYSVGGLDKDLEGLFLMTNQGDLADKTMKGGNIHEREYIITMDKPVTEHFPEQIAEGIRLPELGQVTRPCKVKKVERNTFSIILTQDPNRQIRQMCEVYGCQVRRLVRVRIMNIHLGNLRTGAYRQMTKEKYEEFTGLLKSSSSLSLEERKSQ